MLQSKTFNLCFKNSLRRISILLTLVLLFCAEINAQDAFTYTRIPFTVGRPYKISNSSWIVGSSAQGRGCNGTFTSPGVVEAYGYATNNTYRPGCDSSLNLIAATSVNEEGWVVGVSTIGSYKHKEGRYHRSAFLSHRDTIFFAGTFDTLNFTAFEDINNSKKIAGTNIVKVSDSTAYPHAVLFNATLTSFQDLGVLQEGLSSYAYGLNDNDVVVGESEITNRSKHAFRSFGGGHMSALSEIAGTLTSAAYEVNNAGTIIGVCDNKAVKWQGGIQELPIWVGVTKSVPYDINELGEIVGEVTDADGTHGVLWLTTPNYGLAAGIHKLKDVSRMDDWLLIHSALSISDKGVIVCLGGSNPDPNESSYGVLLQHNFIVNSTGDGADADLSDGLCLDASGNCTMRAAIEQANEITDSTRWKQGIAFNILASNPVIQVQEKLPMIRGNILIDASGQPNSEKVFLDGSAISDPTANGLVFSGIETKVRGLGIGNFPSNGIDIGTVFDSSVGILFGENNYSGVIENCQIGIGPNNDTTWGNGGHGVNVRGNTRNFFIGDYVRYEFTPEISTLNAERANIIAYNAGAGIMINKDSVELFNPWTQQYYWYVSQGDAAFWGNSIYKNGKMGIDIYPEGPKPNTTDLSSRDIEDNYPNIDSIRVANGEVTVHGHLNARSTGYIDEWVLFMELFLSYECDESGYGEGRTRVAFDSLYFLDTLIEDFALSFPEPLNPGWFITGTASGYSSTSEFSPCASPPLIVNSNSDLPDLLPNDSLCWTGVTLSNGKLECSFRAALEFANAHPGYDEIIFDIPDNSLPFLQPATSYPSVTEEIHINASTQSGLGYIIIDGSNAGAGSVSGLTLNTYSSMINGLIINNFSGAGIKLDQADGNLLYNNIIGTDITHTKNLGNTLHGVHVVNSNDNVIGGYESDLSNTIAYNNLTGIFIESGAGNSFVGNKIFSNIALGIDISPIGVNKNDTLDSDVGANALVNFPIIESVSNQLNSSTITGRYVGNPFDTVLIQFFYNDVCDTSGYGEGLTLVSATAVITDNNGIGSFVAVASAELGENQFATAISTDRLNNSSEFSKCWPTRQFIKLTNSFGKVIPNKKIEFYHVLFEPPVYTETFIDTILTNDSGYFEVTKYIITGDIKPKDTVKFSMLLHSEPAVKHLDVLGTAHSVTLDNGWFSKFGVMYHDEFKPVDSQSYILNHTTVAFNLVVSIEWDADLTYLEGTMDGFRNTTNYFYDVSDGQMVFDTILIYDNGEHWEDADFQINASNMVWPHVDRISGVQRKVGPGSDPVEMPRKWFGNADATRNMTYTESPLMMNSSGDYRTRLHEFSHYALSLKDEYSKFTNSNPRCGSIKNYGFMDHHYIGDGVYASEMSDQSTYTDVSCRNNRQWRTHSASCWRIVEVKFQRTYSDVFAPIYTSMERAVPVGLDYFPGPNNSLGSIPVNYDVGSHVVFPILTSAPSASTVTVLAHTAFSSDSLPDVEVTSYKPLSLRTMVQGNTADNGKIQILGAETGDIITVAGVLSTTSSSNISLNQMATKDTWVFGEGVIGGSGISKFDNNFSSSSAGDSLTLLLNVVEGNYPLIPSVSLHESTAEFRLYNLNDFSEEPSVDHENSSGTKTSYATTLDASGYLTTISDSLTSTGNITFWAKDDSASLYFVKNNYVKSNFDSSLFALQATTGDVVVEFDSSNSGLTQGLILTSIYPIIRTGLDPNSQQAGNTHSLSIYPHVSLTGENIITIRYQDSDLSNENSSFGYESALRIFHWDETIEEWVIVGGSVDTTFNEVTASITKDGVYAAFTTDIATDIGDATGNVDNLPYQFELAQNYPNPFNPSTEINFSLPARSHVILEIFNVLGQKVKTLIDADQHAGNHKVLWDGNDSNGQPVSSGVYLYRFNTGDYSESKKMLLLK